jgi:hypothetical protein
MVKMRYYHTNTGFNVNSIFTLDTMFIHIRVFLNVYPHTSFFKCIIQKRGLALQLHTKLQVFFIAICLKTKDCCEVVILYLGKYSISKPNIIK